jgi:penicillin-binding protein 1A
MESLLVQVFATLLTLSQVFVQPQELKTAFDPAKDQAAVVSLLRQGCAHMRRAFEIENLNLDDLVATAMDDPDARSAKFRGVSFADMHEAYKSVCKQESGKLPVDLAAVIEFHNRALSELPDHTRLVDLKLPATTTILDRNGRKFAEVYEAANRRVPVKLSAVSPLLQGAFIATEDKRFREHKGIDERAIVRAFVANVAGGEMQGGSTITQQLAKNLLVGTQNNYVRKMREMVMASRIETVLSKDAILELYLNAIYLGRGAWGVQTAAQSYFGKDTSALNAGEAALLAGLAKGPNYYSPDRHPDRARERRAYVLNRMREEDVISAEQYEQALAEQPSLIARDMSRRTTGYHVVDHIRREARRVADIKLLSEEAFVIRSTLDVRIQQAAESALQEGLFSYERSMGRARFEGPEMNLGDRINAPAASAASNMPRWQQALASARLPHYDVQWPAAVVLSKAELDKTGVKPRSGGPWVGLADGRIVELQTPGGLHHKLKPYDVVYVRLAESKSKKGGITAELRSHPKVQGAVVVLENSTGRILAMTGGFSYPVSQLNRATQAARQPGSALKPLTYLAALAKGLQPTTLVRDSSLTLPPIGKAKRARPDDWWSPGNYDGKSGSTLTLRQALEKSRNLATAHLMAEGIASTPQAGLKEICNLARELKIYDKCINFYPFVLGAQGVRPIDLARFYATVANEGLLPDTHVIETISDQSGERFAYGRPQTKRIKGADAAAFYQLKSILQGVVLRGTAARLSAWAPYMAGKTGTTNEETDAWFVGFSNDVTVAVWVGYDNRKKTETLGHGRTGGNTALPIFAPIMEAAWREYAPQAPLAPPRDAAAQLIAASDAQPRSKETSRDERSGTRRGKSFEIVEYLRKDAKGKAIDKRYALISERSPQPAQLSEGSQQPAQRARSREYSRENFPRGYAAARPDEPQQRSQERSWGRFGNQGGWGSPGPFGQGPFGPGPGTFGPGGSYWRQ